MSNPSKRRRDHLAVATLCSFAILGTLVTSACATDSVDEEEGDADWINDKADGRLSPHAVATKACWTAYMSLPTSATKAQRRASDVKVRDCMSRANAVSASAINAQTWDMFRTDSGKAFMEYEAAARNFCAQWSQPGANAMFEAAIQCEAMLVSHLGFLIDAIVEFEGYDLFHRGYGVTQFQGCFDEHWNGDADTDWLALDTCIEKQTRTKLDSTLIAMNVSSGLTAAAAKSKVDGLFKSRTSAADKVCRVLSRGRDYHSEIEMLFGVPMLNGWCQIFDSSYFGGTLQIRQRRVTR